MDIDWEVEIGGDAPVIHAHWPGLIDLRLHPQRIDEISEVTLMPSLRDLLLALNSGMSPVWTSKCDVWAPEPNAIACYVDMLPRDLQLFANWQKLEGFCQEMVRRIAPKKEGFPLQNSHGRRAFLVADESAEDTSLSLVLRRAIEDGNEGFGVTAYFAATSAQEGSAKSALGLLMGMFSDVMTEGFPRTPDQS